MVDLVFAEAFADNPLSVSSDDIFFVVFRNVLNRRLIKKWSCWYFENIPEFLSAFSLMVLLS